MIYAVVVTDFHGESDVPVTMQAMIDITDYARSAPGPLITTRLKSHRTLK